ncbi:hypothetical protein CDAR_109301 [Caerostris darwini]|uniref:Uncharacterized protein n=1 Tax=Caerostris darwini TaxID=1538125 RepID=A0AAV4TR09_9ARAC|nr:hypothetical protein CDAR_109301 [Caerostris darwini]
MPFILILEICREHAQCVNASSPLVRIHCGSEEAVGVGVGPKRTTTSSEREKKRGIGEEEEEEGFGTRSERGAGAPPEAPPPVGGAHVPLRRRPLPLAAPTRGDLLTSWATRRQIAHHRLLSPAPDGYEAPHPLLAGFGPGKPTVNTPQDNVLPGSGLLLLAGKLFHSNWEYLSNPCSLPPSRPVLSFLLRPGHHQQHPPGHLLLSSRSSPRGSSSHL